MRCGGCQGCAHPRLRECVREFAARLRASPAFVERVRRELAGFFLACCCSSCSDPSKRRLCHGHILF
ncbi:hypothetical protein EMIHUDRAFT_250175 [Emiliania huxleyi CCMP1516]|uniref:Uncharacterized protein n=2 Tax=Emiliania huxleyi TaxID=2903 RepID=A0A0D3I376_EMIH1|nr:hypothetical protein EMIHUDRAFT_250175 [Emiliania huxleyi CCMP1516]EOD05711.1 hypothetical protein EMIHUDRAFT_250175 [Emiliania huxleyi CCMP1516]|eukprot:XP_005758140.1 hypothetical protein EMIHUDRAFT_250175 [Emiliania huxleyi CCMP1516]